MFAQVIDGTDAREHQQVRGVEDTTGQYHFAICLNLSRHTSVCVFDPDRFLAFKQDTTGKSFRLQLKVRARQNGLQEGGSSTATLSITNGELDPRETFLLPRIVVLDIGISGRLGRFDPGIE